MAGEGEHEQERTAGAAGGEAGPPPGTHPPPAAADAPGPAEDNGAGGTGHGVAAQRAERLAKIDALTAAGIDVHPCRFDRTATAGGLHEQYPELAPDSRTGQR